MKTHDHPLILTINTEIGGRIAFPLIGCEYFSGQLKLAAEKSLRGIPLFRRIQMKVHN